jgi:hypothetical protein
VYEFVYIFFILALVNIYWSNPPSKKMLKGTLSHTKK